MGTEKTVKITWTPPANFDVRNSWFYSKIFSLLFFILL